MRRSVLVVSNLVQTWGRRNSHASEDSASQLQYFSPFPQITGQVFDYLLKQRNDRVTLLVCNAIPPPPPTHPTHPCAPFPPPPSWRTSPLAVFLPVVHVRIVPLQERAPSRQSHYVLRYNL